MFKVLVFLILTLPPALALPYAHPTGYPRWEIKGRVVAFSPQQGYITVAGQRFQLDTQVFYKHGLPQVGHWVEVKTYRTEKAT